MTLGYVVMFVLIQWRGQTQASEQLETGLVAVNTGVVAIAEAPIWWN